MITDEELCAFADDMLDPVATARVRSAVEADPLLAARVERMRRQSAALHAAFAGELAKAAPPHLARLVQEGRAARSQAWAGWGQQAAIAAAVGLIAFGLGWSSRPASGTFDFDRRGGRVAGVLAAALEAQPSGDASSEGIAVTLTVPTADSSFCRVFTVNRYGRGAAGLACREADAWKIAAYAETPPREVGSEYALASGTLPDLVLEAAELRRLGDPLDPAEEREAIARDWRTTDE